MKFSEAWLREWISLKLSREELAERLTMTGLEVESLKPVAEHFSRVVVGKVRSFKKHEHSDELYLCEVEIGSGTSLQVVSAATNMKTGMKVPLALVNATLPHNKHIQETKIRGLSSMGMLCSSSDLGLAEESEGLLELPSDAPLGVNLWEYLKLTDHVIEVAITPNRGDCLSIRGMARELAAITQKPLKKVPIPPVKALIPDVFPVQVRAKKACPRYLGRVIRGVKADAMTPSWMKERLRRSGLRSISPIVDVTNYVMLELGQPMHAFDLARLEKKICVRMAAEGEELLLLDGTTVKLTEETLIIADQQKPLAIAGVMGGIDSGISLLTQDIFLESAFFLPSVVARQRQSHHLNSESSYRFERGVDPDLQDLAMERATRLLLDIVGGKPGPVIEFKEARYLSAKTLVLQREQLQSLLGCTSLTDKMIQTILRSLGFVSKKEKNRWRVQVPSWRFDVSEEVDLIEELARLYGYDKLPSTRPAFPVQAPELAENRLTLPRVRRLFCDLGYHEVITYSFVDRELQLLLNPKQQPKVLLNPITEDMNVMRTNLWPGLLGAYLYNRDRQQGQGRFFELGLCFNEEQKHLSQFPSLGGLISGQAHPEQWGLGSRELDFFDLKGDIQKLLQLTHFPQDQFYFKPSAEPVLHPGQTALLYRQEELIGVLGALHPAIRQQFDISEPIYLFEFNLDALLQVQRPYFSEISKFPEIRRDLALLVDRKIPSETIRDAILKSGGEWLRQVSIFDVYLGEGVPENKKSVAFALILQHAARTLRDEEVSETMDRIVGTLKQTLGIELRG